MTHSFRRWGTWVRASVLGPALALAVVLSCGSGVAVVRASCVPPPLDLLWTYPADGAVDVPTNAVFWLVASGWGRVPRATLSGANQAVTRVTFGASSIEPGLLEPETEYVLALDYPESGAATGGSSLRRAIHFRTGGGPAEPLPAPEVAGSHTSREMPSTVVCRDVLAAQDCFDTGQNTLLRFEVGDARAVAWLVRSEYMGESAVWPVGCGEPALFVHGDRNLSCKDVSAIGPGGLVGGSTRYCPPTRPATTDGSLGAGEGGAGDAGEKREAGAADGGDRSATDPTPRGQARADAGCRAGGTRSSEAWLVVLGLLVVARCVRRRTRLGSRAGSSDEAFHPRSSAEEKVAAGPAA